MLLMKKLETEKGGAKINAWLDSMRTSSPTRIRSTTTASLPKPTTEAPGFMFEQIVAASTGKQIVMFLDYDGTLSPIVEDRIELSCLKRLISSLLLFIGYKTPTDSFFVSNQMRATVREVARYFTTAIVTGRCRDKVYSFVKLAGLYYAGSHGMDIKGPSKSYKYKKAASEFLPMIDEVYRVLVEKTKSIPGTKVENNKFCVSVHFRCVDEKSWFALADQVRLVLDDYPQLKLTQGRKVKEFLRRLVDWKKLSHRAAKCA
ncbi:putative trehalose-phosphate phosphatase 6 [Hibiscus syriacus]|uniref:Trehalose-phosphate phosphatase 6 n=1 Tax=Hibiscus syriacus TaxID=106335 RepID=A0A6A2XR93_HIBSY|nr:putative trehalose-phosphate phosphatase 6 [Hibiscus syriacus]